MICLLSDPAFSNENVVGRPGAGAAAITAQDAAGAQVMTQRMLTNPAQLSEKIRAVMNLRVPPPGVGRLALPAEPLNGQSHPFTTKNASAEGGIGPVDQFPWRATGKMFMRFGPSTFVCTGSVIGRNLLVTAAHCVHNYGGREKGFADAVTFEPARHGDGPGSRPFGTWTAKEWWIPKAYFEGADICSVNAPGIVCENDIAVVVLEKSGDRFVADRTGKLGFRSDEYGYGSFFGNRAGQITQLGYPSDRYDGFRMIRTDSLGYHDAPNNVIIGSAQTGGSSGGPWIMNFGIKTSYQGVAPLDDDDNQVVATTSWGYNDNRFMVQGGSRFGKNFTYTVKSNIQSLVDTACAANPGFC
ncbi:trypsin-like serine peptidase [Pseudorhodoplanes sp.]|uniref:trypsin-like serine peptidase n=1 Tax=Pseudorhodoplanes sp. TaxID=1934341 RepID=UPI003D144F44